MSLQLRQSASTICDATGVGTLAIGPGAANESWLVDSLSVYNSSDVNISRSVPITATLYKNVVGPSSIIAGTYNGVNDTNTGSTIRVQSGESVVVQWTGGDSGSVCTVYVEGTMELRGVRIY